MSEREAIIREMAKKKVVHQLPGMEALPVRRDLTYRSTSGSQLPLDIYYPSSTDRRAPVVLAPLAYPDPQGGVRTFGPLTSWAQLMAASTLVSLPSAILFGIFQRYLVSGFLSGSVRG